MAETVFSLWCLWSAPLLMSNDLGKIPPASKKLLQNTELLAVNQDALGRMASRFSVTLGASGAEGAGQGWRKDLANGDVAVVLFNPGESATKLSFDLVDAGFAPDTRVHVMDLLAAGDGSGSGEWSRGSYETAKAIAPHGSAALRLSFMPRYPDKEL